MGNGSSSPTMAVNSNSAQFWMFENHLAGLGSVEADAEVVGVIMQVWS